MFNRRLQLDPPPRRRTRTPTFGKLTHPGPYRSQQAGHNADWHELMQPTRNGAFGRPLKPEGSSTDNLRTTVQGQIGTEGGSRPVPA